MRRFTIFALPASIAVGALAALALSATLGLAATHAGPLAPKNTSPPTISGTPQVGSTLTADPGNWTSTTPITYSYQWRRCDQNGGSCADISGATDKTYTLKSVDNGNTLRIRVTANNTTGSTNATSVPSAVISTPAAAPQPASTGCPKTTQGLTSVMATDVASPARLQIDTFGAQPALVTSSLQTFDLRVHVSDTCGQPVQGANVFATAVPYNQFSIPNEQPTGSDGWATLHFQRMAGFPLSAKQQLMVFFIRATKPGENVLAGISTRRLVSIRVNLHA